jgi:uncharacterized protein (TIGR03067 family)
MDAGSPEEDPTPEKLRDDRLQIGGDRLTIVEGKDHHRESFSFTLDVSSDPKVMTLITLGDDGKPTKEKMEWIYKFEGDTLVVAFIKGGDAGRLADFNGAAWAKVTPGKPGVTRVRLKKTTEAPPADPIPRSQTTMRTTAPRRGTGK